jgi:5'-nucleotidase
VKAIVVLIHEGGTPRNLNDPNTCDVTGPIVDIANGLSPDVDVIVSGHTHEAYNCRIGSKLVTSAGSYSRLVTDIDLTIDRRTGRVVNKTARNIVVTRDVARSSDESALIAHYEPFARTLGSKVVGSITAPIVREPNTVGESALGDVIADAMLEAARARIPGGAALAFWNPGGIRSDLTGTGGGSAQGRNVTYEEVFDVLPFGNQLVVRTMTGEALVQLLEQQFDNPSPGRMKLLQVSSGFTYQYSLQRPAGRRIDPASVMIDGRPLIPTMRYRVGSSDFVWGGGDGFTPIMAIDPVGVAVDVEVLLEYLSKHMPISPGPQSRVRVDSE